MSSPAPLLMVSGAPGSGKSFLLPELVRRGDGLVVMDLDELLEDGALIGVPIATPDAAADWPAYNRMWQRITLMTRRSGHPVLLLSPLDPAELEGADAWALLDCADDIRRQRLTARGWDEGQIDDALSDAAKYRALFTTRITTDDNVTRVASQVLAWARREVSRTNF